MKTWIGRRQQRIKISRRGFVLWQVSFKGLKKKKWNIWSDLVLRFTPYWDYDQKKSEKYVLVFKSDRKKRNTSDELKERSELKETPHLFMVSSSSLNTLKSQYSDMSKSSLIWGVTLVIKFILATPTP